MSALALSVLLSLVSAVAYAGGAIVQEQVAVSAPHETYLPLRRPGWWGALALNGLGGVLHVVALACGPLSLVQPLGALTIVFALPLAALCVGRRAGATAWRGALMATVGLAGLLSLVGTSGAHSLTPAQRVAAALVTGGAVVALMCAGLAAHRHPAMRSVLLATASGIAFGMSSVFTKTVAVDRAQGFGPADLASLAAVCLFAAAGVLLSQAAYRGGGLTAPLATLTVVNPVLAAVVGVLMFGETFRHGSTGTVLALACAVVTAGGLVMLTTERMGGTSVPGGAEPGEVAAGMGAFTETAARVQASAETAPGVPAFAKTAARVRPFAEAAAGVQASAETAPGVRALAEAGPVVGAFAGTSSSAGGASVRDAAEGLVVVPRQRTVEPGAGTAGPAPRELPGPGPGGSGTDPGGALPAPYTPLRGGVRVPLPVLDRHRTRVGS
ncbi:DMT family transporter [Streptomyces sp. NPDC058299]|uniref:DMT family transporter n=1 Tax=Streptomyces sp. NPDC058299 TaxID=3346435 RepID=UPI0036EDEBD1